MSDETTAGTTPSGAEVPLRSVRIIGMPVALQLRAEQQNDELVREFQLIAQGQSRDGQHTELPKRLLQLVEQLSGQYGPFTTEQEQQLADAHAAGRASIDMTYQLPESVAEGARALGGMLDEADQFCRDGQYLLTLAAPPDLVAFRTWFLSEIIDHMAGKPPTSWADWERAHR